MAAKDIPPQAILRQLFDYESETGFLYRKLNSLTSARGWTLPGTRAFLNETSKGYYRGGLLGRNVMAHRVVWKWHHGTEPEEIDHINGIKTDNRIENLRPASRQENNRNSAIRKNNTSGVQGVCWHKTKKRWIAAIRANGRSVEIGSFRTLSEAAEARKSAEGNFGYHPNHGRFPNA